MADNIAIITGAGRGIGRAVATALAADGFAVAALARTAAEVERTATEIRSGGGQAVAVVADLASTRSTADIVAAAQQQLGGSYQILVNAAGITGPVTEIGEIDLDEWRTALDVNVTGALAMCQAVLPDMTAHGSGRIVNVISGLAHRPQPGLAAYCTSKAALLQLTRVLDAETRAAGVRAFALEPGLVRTGMSDSLRALPRSGVGTSVQQMLDRLETNQGFVEPEESARLICLAATGRADDLAGDAHSIYDPGIRPRLADLAAGTAE